MQALFNHFAITMTRKTAETCAHQGQCDADVAWAIENRKVKFHGMTPDNLRAELKEYGAWNADELADHNENVARIVWIAAGNIMDELHEKARA